MTVFYLGDFYGPTPQVFIHIHHIVSLAEIGKSYLADSVKDLVPLCANFHSVVHLTKPMLIFSELKKLTNRVTK